MSYRTIEVKRIAGALGAEVHGADLAKPLGDEQIAEIRRAWLDHLVIFFRDQHLAPAQFMAFARTMGEPIEYPFVKGLEGFPEIIEVKKLEHERVNFGGIWHSDTTYLAKPPMASMLLASEVPPFGGDTLFANMYLAYETLSDGLKRLLDGLSGGELLSPGRRVEDARGPAQVGRPRRTRAPSTSRAPGGAHPPGDGAQGPLRQRRAHRPVRGHDRGRERPAPGVPLSAPGRAGAHVPFRHGLPARSPSGTIAACSTTPSTTIRGSGA